MLLEYKGCFCVQFLYFYTAGGPAGSQISQDPLAAIKVKKIFQLRLIKNNNLFPGLS
jgi:hypothetical protein